MGQAKLYLKSFTLYVRLFRSNRVSLHLPANYCYTYSRT